MAFEIAAARRGASLRVLLNGAGGVHNNIKSQATCRRMNALARAAGLDLVFRLGSLPDARPGRDRPIHNKMLLARVAQQIEEGRAHQNADDHVADQ